MNQLRASRRRRRRQAQARPWIAVAGLFVLLWLSLSTVLYAPWWAVALVVLLLVPQALLVRRWARTRPRATPWVPAAGVALWFAVVLAGVRWFDWSA